MNNQIQFINKIWIAEKGKKIDHILWVCCWIYLALNLVVFIMEGFNALNIFMIVFSIAAILLLRKKKKLNGRYIESNCIITFNKDKIVWEYPYIDLFDGKNSRHLTYEIYDDYIFNIAKSHEMNSIRIGCCPLVNSKYENGKTETYDCRKRMKEVVLHTYNYDSNELKDLFEQYTSQNVIDLK